MRWFERWRKLGATMSRNVAHQEGMPFLRVNDLSINYDGMPALREIGFELHGGEQIAVVGPNGAGKSTLFKAIAGLVTPSAGQVQLSGHAPSGHICIAYLPQRSEVDWNFPVTVCDVVMMGRVGKLGLLRWPRAKDWQFVETCLAAVNLQALAQRRINQLSGGQQQRMFIAQALAQEAELMMMDEPLNGLDVTAQEEVYRVLDDLRQRKVTLMISTHDLRQVTRRFERVMLLNHELLGYGPPSEVLTKARLLQAYGAHLHLLEDEDGVVILDHD